MSASTPRSAHLKQLRASIIDELRLRGKPVQFDALQTMMRGQGFSRAEIIGAVNALVDIGKLRFERRAFNDVIMSRSAGIRVFVVLVAGGEA